MCCCFLLNLCIAQTYIRNMHSKNKQTKMAMKLRWKLKAYKVMLFFGVQYYFIIPWSQYFWMQIKSVCKIGFTCSVKSNTTTSTVQHNITAYHALGFEPGLEAGDVRWRQAQQGLQAVGDDVHLVLGLAHLRGVGVEQQLVRRVPERQHAGLVLLQVKPDVLQQTQNRDGRSYGCNSHCFLTLQGYKYTLLR